MKKYYVLAKGLNSGKKFYMEFESLRLAEYFRLMFRTANYLRNGSYVNIRTNDNINEEYSKLDSNTVSRIYDMWKYMREKKEISLIFFNDFHN